MTAYAASSNQNFQLAAELFDVTPDGTAPQTSHGSILVSLGELDHAKTWSDRAGTPLWPWRTLVADSYLTPGTAVRLDIAPGAALIGSDGVRWLGGIGPRGPLVRPSRLGDEGD